MLSLKSLRRVVLPIVVGLALLESAFGQLGYGPILLHPRRGSDSLPVAIYQNIKVEDFRKLVIGAFEESGFSFIAITKTKDGETRYKFSYRVPVGGSVQNVELLLGVGENLDKNKRCANCFLRLFELPEIPTLRKLPWMTQYEVSGHVFPAIDRAFAKIRVDGQSSMDRSFAFNYSDQWQGERNLHGNSFVAISFDDLKIAIIESYRAAGFILVEDNQKESPSSGLAFSYPIDANQTSGVVYKMRLESQFDERGNCYPCEMWEAYDPYQQLPPAGLSGMADRLSLESRFTAARTLAYERLKSATERYLRPRSAFVVPPKPAALGSPRPRFVLPPVT